MSLLLLFGDSGPSGEVKIFDGSSKPLKIWNGVTWETKPLYYFNGTTWTKAP